MATEMLIVDVAWGTGAPYSIPDGARHPDWDLLDPALHGDLSAAQGIPTGSHLARDFQPIPSAPAIRIVVGEMPREGML